MERGRQHTEVGEVVSDKMNKTITVRVSRMVKHKKYGKYLRRHTVFKAHDEKNEAKTGDQVQIYLTRPLSKDKRWRLDKILVKAREQGA
ncbi:MAG TPA: 30S ribosomal protein S17 [Bdellovibrionales bacterium]|nr:30S ribosomal protein S17 [Bdellovibrionales bacterium]